jgi:hypothetical protein
LKGKYSLLNICLLNKNFCLKVVDETIISEAQTYIRSFCHVDVQIWQKTASKDRVCFSNYDLYIRLQDYTNFIISWSPESTFISCFSLLGHVVTCSLLQLLILSTHLLVLPLETRVPPTHLLYLLLEVPTSGLSSYYSYIHCQH